MLAAALHKDVINIIQAKFTSLENVICIHLNVSLLGGIWNSVKRILALVEHKESVGLFLLTCEKSKPLNISDLAIETVVPIDRNFNCYTESTDTNYTNLNFIIQYRKIKIECCIEIGPETSYFASAIAKSQERVLQLNLNLDYKWLQKYTNPLFSSFNLNPVEMEIANVMDPPTRKHDPAEAASNRQSILNYYLKQREPEYTQKQEFIIFVGTWNVNGQPPTIPLDNWLSCDADPPDVYAIGFQEIDLSKEAFLFNDTVREAEWEKSVTKAVHPKAKYRTVAVTRLVGIMLIVLVNNEHYPYVKNVSVDNVGTGLLGKMGNKGGVAVRLQLYNTTLCFVNSHLAAHVEEYERRNQDYRDINARINFRNSPQAIKDHNQIYWLGDLNYRITELNVTQVKTLLQRNEITTLLKADQLNQQKERGNVLLDYKESDIYFPPTYKYDLNSDIFDTSEKARPPAWTDRILWRGNGIYQKIYRSHMDLRISDHKPVSAIFKSEISVIDQNKHRKVHEDVLKIMDKKENEFLPHVTIDQTEVIFDLVKFRETQVREIIIANTGQVPTEFEFIKKLEESSYCKDWLRISPYCGTVDPGEKCDVRLEVNLESDLDKIYDILVLHLKGGKDMFIIVNGNCQRSCFTAPISSMCRASVPIMRLSEEQRIKCDKCEGEPLYSVPREIWLLIDHLYRYGLKTRNLFESTTLPGEFIKIRDWLDFGSLEPLPGSIQAVAESLLLLLSYTKDPVIPFIYHDKCVAAANNFQTSRQIMQSVPDLHRNVFLYICLFLQELAKHSNENRYDAKTLSSLFGDILLRDPVRNSRPQASRGKANFVYNFLVNDLSTAIMPLK